MPAAFVFRENTPAAPVTLTLANGAQQFLTAALNQANFGAFRHIPDTDSSLADSLLNGTLATMRDATLSLFGAAAAEPVVQVYTGTGTVA